MAGWRNITGDHVFGRATAALITIWSAWVYLLIHPSDLPGALRSGLAAVLAMTALQVIRIGGLVWVKGAQREQLTVVALALTIMIHGYVRTRLLHLAHYDISVVLFGGALLITVYTLGIHERMRRRLTSLRAEQSLLIARLDERIEAHDLARDEVLLGIEHLIDEEVNTYEGPRTTSAQLRRVATDVIRPISHELSAELRLWAAPSPDRTAHTASWQRAWQQVNATTTMEPVALTAIVSFMALATGFWHAVAAVILTPLAAWATTFILPRFTTPTDNTGRIALAIIAPFIATLPASLLSGHMTLMIGTVPLLTIAHSLLSRMTSESLFAERALMRSCAQLSWATSRTSLVEWFQRSEVSRGMHGPIQTAIANTIPRLADAVERNEQTFGLVGELQRRIVHALGSLVNPRAESMNLEQELFDIVETWAGVATIQVDVAPDFLLPLSSDPACATAVVDTVAEACATAVRQHNATEIVVTVAPAPNAVLVNVTDNGRIGIANVDTDLTLHLLEYCSLRWYRRHLATTNVIAAVLPYRPEHAITSPRAALTRIQRHELSQ